MLKGYFLKLLFLMIAGMWLWCLEPAFFGTRYAEKMKLLRNGEVVQLESGRKGRLNFKNSHLETSDGRSIYVGDDPDFFPHSKLELEAIEAKESFKSNHPITHKTLELYKKEGSALWLVLGVFFGIYVFWILLKLITRELFFTAKKAIEDAKKD